MKSIILAILIAISTISCSSGHPYRYWNPRNNNASYDQDAHQCAYEIRQVMAMRPYPVQYQQGTMGSWYAVGQGARSLPIAEMFRDCMAGKGYEVYSAEEVERALKGK